MVNYYTDDSAKIEQVEFDDGTVWGADDFAQARIRGTSAGENLEGENDVANVFDSDAGGNDKLRGRSGNDVYWLGAGTDNDVIQEYYYNLGDDGDVIKIEEGYGINNVRLELSSNGLDLIVKLLDDTRAETGDSLRVQLHFADSSAFYYKTYMQGSAIESIEFNDGTVWGADDIDYYFSAIRGTSADEDLYGLDDYNDVFDANAGGNDYLYGYGGDDTYWLGYGTDRDVIREYNNNNGDANDVIKLKKGIGTEDVQLVRHGNGNSLIVQLLAIDGSVSDSLTVANYYTDDSAKIEQVEFTDGTVWGADDFAQVRIRGTSAGENLEGDNDVANVFDSDAGGNDKLRGRSGNDVYWLGAGTDNDLIQEYHDNLGDDGDVIKIEEGYGINNVRLEINNTSLIVKLLDDTRAETGDSLTVQFHFADPSADYYKDYMQGSAVEQIEADGKVLLSSQYTALINEIAAFENGTSTSGYNSTAEITSDFWNDISTISNPT